MHDTDLNRHDALTTFEAYLEICDDKADSENEPTDDDSVQSPKPVKEETNEGDTKQGKRRNKTEQSNIPFPHTFMSDWCQAKLHCAKEAHS